MGTDVSYAAAIENIPVLTIPKEKHPEVPPKSLRMIFLSYDIGAIEAFLKENDFVATAQTHSNFRSKYIRNPLHFGNSVSASP